MVRRKGFLQSRCHQGKVMGSIQKLYATQVSTQPFHYK